MYPVDVGGDLTIPLQTAAIALLPGMRGQEAETVPLLATLVTRPALRQAALAAIRRMPAASWPPAQVPAVAREVLRDLSAIPAAQRIGPAVAETFAFGRELVARLPDGPDRQAMAAQLEALLVRVIRIEAVAAQMKFDVSRFTVTAGETVVIELVNKDEMPHNLVVGKEGALETVGLAADKMVALPDAFAKNFVPATPEVLFSIRLLNPGETVQARFTAPTQPGNYPFICTFPAHWRTMNGIIEVRPAASPGLPAMTRLVSLLLVMAGVCLPAQAPPPPVPSSAAGGPHVVFVTGDDEYRSEISMPMIAAILEKRHGLRTSVAYARPTPQTKDHIEGLEALETADLMVMFAALPGAARCRAEPDPRLREDRQADGRLPHQHARLQLSGRQPPRRLERRLRP